MIVVYRTKERAFFIYGFAENARDNIEDDELQTLRDVAIDLLARDDAALDRANATDELQEIENGDDETQCLGGGDARDRRRLAPRGPRE